MAESIREIWYIYKIEWYLAIKEIPTDGPWDDYVKWNKTGMKHSTWSHSYVEAKEVAFTEAENGIVFIKGRNNGQGQGGGGKKNG